MSNLLLDVPSLEGVQVSYDGEVYQDGRHLRKSVNKVTGYVTVRVRGVGPQYVHRLVAEAFIANPNGYPEVNHKNEKKADNRASNLEWCTHTYNMHYGTCPQRISDANSIPVVMMSRDNKVLAIYPSGLEARRANGFKGHDINKALKDPNKTYNGYKWKYLQ